MPAQAEIANPELAEIIFSKPEAHVFAVLDGASNPDLVKQLYALKPEYCCLYRGELPPDMATVAPYLVHLEPEHEFTQMVLSEGWGAHWGIFFNTMTVLRALRDHFREFHSVELPDQRTVLFRYYDPRVLRSFLPACNAAELNSFFGPVLSFFVEGDSNESGVKYTFANKALKTEQFDLKKAP